MSEVPQYKGLIELTPELIHEQTGYKLFAYFPEFSESGRISPDLHGERERLASEIGEDNVMPSMFIDENGKIALGLFTKEPEVSQDT